MHKSTHAHIQVYYQARNDSLIGADAANANLLSTSDDTPTTKRNKENRVAPVKQIEIVDQQQSPHAPEEEHTSLLIDTETLHSDKVESVSPMKQLNGVRHINGNNNTQEYNGNL
jgi:hypothetical protein